MSDDEHLQSCDIKEEILAVFVNFRDVVTPNRTNK